MPPEPARTAFTAAERSAAHTRTTGLRFWLPAVAVLVGVVILVPVVWVALARFAGLPLGSASATSDLLAVIGGVMGAIFTVGGLVIALVSVYTQLAIETRIRQSFEDLLPELDMRARAQIEAYIAFTRATEESNWRQAQELAREALEKWPALPGVRRFLAVKMSDDVVHWFYWHEVMQARASSMFGNYRDGSWSQTFVTSIYGMAPTFPDPTLYLRREDTPLIEAVTWLQDAIAHGEDTDSDLRARLALMYGAAERFDDMLRTLKTAVEHNEGLKPYFQVSLHLAMLANACVSQYAPVRLGNVGNVIGISLPATQTEVLASLQAVNMSPGTASWNAYWLAMKKSTVADPGQPGALGMLHMQLSGQPDARTGVARWMVGRQGQEETTPADGNPIPIERLVNMLEAKFIFVCQHESGWTAGS